MSGYVVSFLSILTLVLTYWCKPQDQFTDRVPQEHKDKANEQYDKAKNFLTEEYFPEERRDQFIYRGKEVIVECQKHKDYQESIRWLLNSLEEYASHGQTVLEHGQ